jgi:hypothetical protein
MPARSSTARAPTRCACRCRTTAPLAPALRSSSARLSSAFCELQPFNFTGRVARHRPWRRSVGFACHGETCDDLPKLDLSALPDLSTLTGMFGSLADGPPPARRFDRDPRDVHLRRATSGGGLL